MFIDWSDLPCSIIVGHLNSSIATALLLAFHWFVHCRQRRFCIEGPAKTETVIVVHMVSCCMNTWWKKKKKKKKKTSRRIPSLSQILVGTVPSKFAPVVVYLPDKKRLIARVITQQLAVEVRVESKPGSCRRNIWAIRK